MNNQPMQVRLIWTHAPGVESPYVNNILNSLTEGGIEAEEFYADYRRMSCDLEKIKMMKWSQDNDTTISESVWNFFSEWLETCMDKCLSLSPNFEDVQTLFLGTAPTYAARKALNDPNQYIASIHWDCFTSEAFIKIYDLGIRVYDGKKYLLLPHECEIMDAMSAGKDYMIIGHTQPPKFATLSTQRRKK